MLSKTAYTVAGDTGAALVVSGYGARFNIWTTQLIALEAEGGYQLFGRIGRTVVMSDGVRLTWETIQYRVWVAKGPSEGDQLPSLEQVSHIVSATA